MSGSNAFLEWRVGRLRTAHDFRCERYPGEARTRKVCKYILGLTRMLCPSKEYIFVVSRELVYVPFIRRLAQLMRLQIKFKGVKPLWRCIALNIYSEEFTGDDVLNQINRNSKEAEISIVETLNDS